MNMQEMFNEEQKKEYLINNPKNSEGLKNYFKRLAPYEKMFEKDLSEMNVNELISVFLALNIKGVKAKEHILSMMRQYIDWCIYSGKTMNTENKLDNIRGKNITSKYAIRSQMLKSPEQVIYILERAFKKDYFQQENRVKRDSLAFWLLYAGMDIKELPLLKKSDIDTVKKTVQTDNNDYDINEEAAALWENCAKMEFIETIGNGKGEDIRERQLADNDYLFRQINDKVSDSSAPIMENYFRAILRKIFKQYFEETKEFLNVSATNVRKSGIFYKWFLYEGKNKCLPSSDMICRYFNVEYNDKKITNEYSVKILREFYEWKDTFDLN